MPMFEYECRHCGREFETLVTASRQPECPDCHGRELEKLVSVFGVGSSTGDSGGASFASGAT